MQTTTEMQLVSTDKLIPYVNNARTHSAEQIMKLRSSLREFGFINPVIIDREFNVIAGHGRIAAAKAEGIEEVPCAGVPILLYPFLFFSLYSRLLHLRLPSLTLFRNHSSQWPVVSALQNERHLLRSVISRI